MKSSAYSTAHVPMHRYATCQCGALNSAQQSACKAAFGLQLAICRYGDIHPASVTAKICFMLYVVLSAIVQLTVLATFVHTSINFHVEPGVVPQDTNVRPFVPTL